jgi:hypothetical protein
MGWKKLRVRWTPQLDQDLAAMTTEGSMAYDEELTKNIITEYGSVEAYKNSDTFKNLYY